MMYTKKNSTRLLYQFANLNDLHKYIHPQTLIFSLSTEKNIFEKNINLQLLFPHVCISFAYAIANHPLLKPQPFYSHTSITNPQFNPPINIDWNRTMKKVKKNPYLKFFISSTIFFLIEKMLQVFSFRFHKSYFFPPEKIQKRKFTIEMRKSWGKQKPGFYFKKKISSARKFR